MNTLRIMARAYGSRILLVLLLASPSLAGAQCTVAQCQFLVATSGGISVDAVHTSSDFHVAGPLFTENGTLSFGGSPFLPTVGLFEGIDFSLTLYGDTFADLNGIDAGLDDVVFANVTFSADDISIPGPGIHTQPFLFESDVRTSLEGDFIFYGRGIITYDVVPTDTPGIVNILSANYTITNPFQVPEPSTASLLLLGFAGLVVLGRRVRSLAPT
jgi:PEP-CTERM motif-containing protein